MLVFEDSVQPTVLVFQPPRSVDLVDEELTHACNGALFVLASPGSGWSKDLRVKWISHCEFAISRHICAIWTELSVQEQI